MELLRIVILAVVQGLTEFLPISSDGHLLVVAAMFEACTGRSLAGDQLTLTIVLHAGTLGTVLVAFRREILRLLTVDRRVIGLLIVGTLPAAVIGLPLKYFCKPLLESPLAAGLGLIGTGLVLLWSARRQTDDSQGQSYASLGYVQALVIGTFQAIAVLPGVSRSGLTIASGLSLAKLKRSDAANFSFLLSIPAIGGAVLVELVELIRHGAGDGLQPLHLVVGAAVSMLVGFVALGWLLNWLRAGRLRMFAWWCLPLGTAVTIWQLLKS